MKPEQEFYNYLRAHLKGHVQRMENIAGSGVPDLSIGYLGREIWVELKVAEPLILLRKEQYAWSMRRSQCGGEIFVIGSLGGEHVIGWKFPDIHVRPYGNSEKYVKVISPPNWSLMKSEVKHKLMSYLFSED